jgi:chromosomal replication initiator protein
LPEPLWNRCLRVLEGELPEQQFNTWVRPLQAVERDGELKLLAPNRYVIEWLAQNLLPRIRELILAFADGLAPEIALDVGTRAGIIAPTIAVNVDRETAASAANRARRLAPMVLGSRINSDFTFDSFVEGKSNQLAKAAAIQVAGNNGKAYNPLFIYGGVGLGKTHLMHAVANKLKEHNSEARLAYVHSERFVGDMVKALQHNTINDFKTAYRSLDCLMIDDIQFFAGKERSQEEFFHTFNALLESQQQVILTCDRYPKEVDGLEERLKSRFGWGLTVAIEPPSSRPAWPFS